MTLCICQNHRMYNTKVTPNVNDELLLIIMYQYWFINCNKCSNVEHLMQDVNNRGIARIVNNRMLITGELQDFPIKLKPLKR